jgi:divalent metal cation (Fe/Co/Zn/Cd) transporter
MSNRDGYEKQKNLSFAQFLAETPSFIAVLVSAILSKAILVFVDLLDSFGNILRTAMVTILSKKLSKDLRFEYNYGVGKIEAIASLICDGIVMFGLLVTLGLSVYSIIFPEQPNDLVIAVVGLKVINVSFDTAFFVKQRKILKTHRSAISETNYAAALAALLFDSVTLVSLLVMWLLRNNPIGGYISPIISIFVAIYLMFGCIRRTRRALDELTDKTLPEEEQMKMLNILTRYYSSYSQFHSINSHKSGDVTRIDIHLSFEQDTTFEEIMTLKKQMQEELDRLFGNCIVNIIVGED